MFFHQGNRSRGKAEQSKKVPEKVTRVIAQNTSFDELSKTRASAPELEEKVDRFLYDVASNPAFNTELCTLFERCAKDAGEVFLKSNKPCQDACYLSLRTWLISFFTKINREPLFVHKERSFVVSILAIMSPLECQPSFVFHINRNASNLGPLLAKFYQELVECHRKYVQQKGNTDIHIEVTVSGPKKNTYTMSLKQIEEIHNYIQTVLPMDHVGLLQWERSFTLFAPFDSPMSKTFEFNTELCEINKYFPEG